MHPSQLAHHQHGSPTHVWSLSPGTPNPEATLQELVSARPQTRPNPATWHCNRHSSPKWGPFTKCVVRIQTFMFCCSTQWALTLFLHFSLFSPWLWGPPQFPLPSHLPPPGLLPCTFPSIVAGNSTIQTTHHTELPLLVSKSNFCVTCVVFQLPSLKVGLQVHPP